LKEKPWHADPPAGFLPALDVRLDRPAQVVEHKGARRPLSITFLFLHGEPMPHLAIDRRGSGRNLFPRCHGLPAVTFGVAMLTAAIGADERRRRQSIELVWTGPHTNVIPVQQTEQVLLDLIGGARRNLLVVSYAVYRIHSIREALGDAAHRGVRVRIVLDLMEPAKIDGYNP